MRTYTLTRHHIHYWKLTLYADGVEVGGGVGGPGDYDFLLEQALTFCGE
jgi:hypothetical protein